MSEVSKAGLVNEDGKIELAFDSDRNLMVVDSIGTPDECRFTINDVQVSKEVAREFYRKTDWVNDVEKAKRTYIQRGLEDWKLLVKSNPPPLDPSLRELISNLYMSCANEITGKRWFDVPKLIELGKELKSWE